MIHAARPLVPFLALVLLVTPAVAVAHAGILDSIKGLFGGGKDKVSGLFGGGGGKAVDELLGQLEQSQKEVASRQESLVSVYNGPASGIKPGDAALSQKLDDLARSSRTNEQLYLRLLQTRADAAKSGGEKALAPFSERIAQITKTQNQLEANYQRIQESNRQAGLIKPVGGAAASATAAASGAARGPAWLDPDARRYIDEWLSRVHLNSWGQWEGTSGTTVVRSAGPTGEPGKDRHEIVWKMLHKDAARSNYTMQDYVEARLRGENPQVDYTPPEGATPAPPTGGGGGGGGGVDPLASHVRPQSSEVREAGATGAGVAAESDLATLDARLKSSYDRLITLQKEGRGDSDEARSLLGAIDALTAQKNQKIRQIPAASRPGNP